MTRRAVAAALAIAVVAITGLAVFGGGSQHPQPQLPAANLNSLIAGAPLQRARCSNWNRASQADKDLAVRALQSAVGGPTEYKGYYGSSLTREQTYQLFDSACSQPVARGFLLYGLYIKDAGFHGAAHPAPPDL